MTKWPDYLHFIFMLFLYYFCLFSDNTSTCKDSIKFKMYSVPDCIFHTNDHVAA